MQISKALNDWHDQNFAEKPIVHNLLQAFCRLIDSLDFLASKRPFSVINKCPPSAHAAKSLLIFIK